MISRLVCALFGHAPLTTAGWKGRTGYARIGGASTDGIGRGHLYLIADCPRCGATYSICNVHGYRAQPSGPQMASDAPRRVQPQGDMA